jgi:hypothetical protein
VTGQISTLEVIISRLEVVVSGPITEGGNVATVRFQKSRDGLCKIASALHEGAQRLSDLDLLGAANGAKVVSESLIELHSRCMGYIHSLGKLLNIFDKTGLTIVTGGKQAYM